MGVGRPLRIATLLGPNTVVDLRRIGLHLDDRGFGATVVEVDTTGVEAVAALAENEVDVLWACGLLTAQLVTAGVAVEVVAAPVFDGESAAVYHSVIVARRGEATPGRRLAVNEFGSWSGYRALIHDAAERADDRWHPQNVDEIVVTGAHVDSVAAVADRRADTAAVDHSIWAWLVATDPEATEGLVVVDRTVDCPAPPFSLGPSLPDDDRGGVTGALFGFVGPPSLVPASIDDYRFMLA